ncbi:hypothetical protein [Catenulispora sp. GP43]|uniref:hypothetical protein n=1 Tax=Catenulispora sp. GP43 TaxID=3156263 RepID=UPI00351977F7
MTAPFSVTRISPFFGTRPDPRFTPVVAAFGQAEPGSVAECDDDDDDDGNGDGDSDLDGDGDFGAATVLDADGVVKEGVAEVLGDAVIAADPESQPASAATQKNTITTAMPGKRVRGTGRPYH